MEERHWWFTGRREIIRRLVHRVLPPGAHHGMLVDIGCGTGGNLAAFSGEYLCYGWDPSEEGIRLARQRYPGLKFSAGSFEEAAASLSPQPDVILAMDVLEHVKEDREFFAKLVKALKPGGHLLITVPAGMELWSPHDVTVGHHRRYTQAELERLWADQPVTATLISYYNARLYPIVRLVRTLTRLRKKTAGEADTDFKMPPAPLNGLLNRIFAGEGNMLIDLVDGKRRKGFARGVSLIALLKKEETSRGS